MSTPNTEPKTTVELIKQTIENDYAWLKSTEQTAWQKANGWLHDALYHLKSLSHIAAFSSLAALAVKLWQHIA